MTTRRSASQWEEISMAGEWREKVRKGVRGMPRLLTAMKDVISCGKEQISLDPRISEWDNPAAYGGHPGNVREANAGN